MLRDKAGHRLFRKVAVKVVFPDNIFPDRTYVQRAGPKQGFGPDGIDDLLMQVADNLDALYPFWEFKMQEMAPEHRTAKYLMTFAGYRTPPAPIQPPTESTTLESEPPADITTEAITAAVGDTLQKLAARATGQEDSRV